MIRALHGSSSVITFQILKLISTMENFIYDSESEKIRVGFLPFMCSGERYSKIAENGKLYLAWYESSSRHNLKRAYTCGRSVHSNSAKWIVISL